MAELIRRSPGDELMADRVRRSSRAEWRADRLRRWWLGALLLVVASVSGCVPSHGPVQRVPGAAADEPLAALGIRVLAQPPRAGAGPEELARQFLLACADPDDDFAVARQFLDPADREAWNPRAQVRIYDGEPADLALSVDGSVMTMAPPATTATIVAGNYALAENQASVPVAFRLVKVKGEWRFHGMPDGIVLPSSLLFAFKPVDVYFLDASGTRLVPDRVFLVASRAGLAEAAVDAVLDGPSPELAGAVRSAFPRGSVTRARPTIRAGILDVDIVTSPADAGAPAGPSGAAAPVRGSNRRAMAAQLIWTASQLPEVTGVRLRINGTRYTSGNADVLRADPDALGFDPKVLPSTAPAFYVVPGTESNVLRSTDGQTYRLAGDGRALSRPAVSLDRRSVAALNCSDGCRSVFLGPLGNVPLRRVPLTVTGQLTTPTWDLAGSGAWTVDSSARGTARVWSIPLTGRPRQVAAPELGPGPVRTLRLSRDGSRVAAIVTRRGLPAVVVGVVLRGPTGVRIERLRTVAPSLAGAVDLAWSDAGHLAVLAKSDAGQSSVTPYRLRIDGSEQPQPVLGTVPGGQPVSIAAAPGQALLVATARQGSSGPTGVSSLQSQIWRQLVPVGADPVYPG